ncbi:DUF3231 family protein [Bacillus sp. AK031]
MENTNHQTTMTAAELGVIWSQYINDSLSKCILRYFVKKTKDDAIREILQGALGLSELHLEKTKQFLKQEQYPIPVGFSDEDVNLDAPDLFTDTYKILYINIMSIHGLTRYAGAVGSSLREDIVSYYIGCTTETMQLYSKSTKVLLEKGIISKPPILTHRPKIEFVGKQSFLTGWFGKRRPINAMEISGTYLNLQKIMGKMVLELGFSQVARTKDVRDFMLRGRKICQKHFKILSSMLEEDHLNVPMTFETEVTDSTEPPFSDKLMLFHINTLLSSAVGYYGEALSVSQRRDIAANYGRMIAEIGILAEDGANLLIEHEWMEKPPGAIDREGLIKDN